MEIIKCGAEHIDAVAQMYDRAVMYLEKTVNYPKWTYGVYPCRKSVKTAVENGVQYACFDGKKVLGAFILNDDPQGDYSVGDWAKRLDDGEYLVIHTLASDLSEYRVGIGQLMVEYCLKYAKNNGFKSVRLDVVPDNVPARKLYEKMGFSFAGEKDLKRNIVEIPMFALYELNF